MASVSPAEVRNGREAVLAEVLQQRVLVEGLLRRASQATDRERSPRALEAEDDVAGSDVERAARSYLAEVVSDRELLERRVREL